MLRCLLFDFFGTLVQYQPGAFVGEPYHATHRLLGELGYPLPYAEFVSRFTAVSDALEREAAVSRREYSMRTVGQAFFRDTFRIEPADAVVDPLVDSFVWEWSRAVQPIPGVLPFLERLAARHTLAIISNTHYPPLIHRNLAEMGIAPLFATVVTSVEHGARKPDPRIFRDTLAALGVAPAEALHIGDSHADDYEGATAAGLRCILIDPQHRWQGRAPQRVAHLFDIEPLLERER